VSHQTAQLAPGRHRSPRDGVCVMELVSMLAGERFSDRPRTACPVIGSFLSAYNDAVDDLRRRDLLLYAPEVVGTRASREVVRRRVELCRGFTARFETGRPAGRGLSVTLRARAEEIGYRAGLAAAGNPDGSSHSMALALLETLIGVHEDPETRRSGRRWLPWRQGRRDSGARSRPQRPGFRGALEDAPGSDPLRQRRVG
jgi:hypothetical protein